MLDGTELRRILPLLTGVAAEYLRTGEYRTVTTLGGESLTPVQRRALDALRSDPTKVSAAALSSVVREGYTADDLQQVLEPIVAERRGREGDLQRETERLSVPSPDRRPAGPLPEGQEYQFDYARNVWMIVQDGTRYIGDVDQQGRTRPSTPVAPEAEPPKRGDTVTTDELGRPTVGLGFGRGRQGQQYGDIELQALGGDVAEGIAAVTGGRDGGIPAGPAAVTDVAETPADANIPEDWRNAAAEAYPNYYAIVRNIPEVAALLERAVAQSFTPEQFQAQLEQTAWWQQTTASAREFEINGQRDPATQQTLIDNKRVEIRDLALSSFGVRLSDKRLDQLAVDSIRYGWSARFLQNAIGDVATQSTAGVSQLREGYIGQQLRKTANDYGIAVSDATFNQWVNKVAVGEESTSSWQDYARVQAKNLFPSIADRIDAGETFQNIVDPYRESAARLLEIDGGEIDFTQPDWIKAITYQDDKGQQRPMSFTEWNDYVRQNRSFGYEFTEQAQQRAYQVANRLADLFGKV
jgi:hypothetical protein